MPSGRTHDLVTLLSLAPTAVLAWTLTRDPATSALVVAATLFGGLMFGPDLDTASRQYSRWGPLRFIWWPYRVFFAHRSRWSHGLLFGTLVRVFYFTGIVALLLIAGVYLRALFVHGAAPGMTEMLEAWSAIQREIESAVGRRAMLAVVAGLWWGAAIHTLLDVLASIARKLLDIF